MSAGRTLFLCALLLCAGAFLGTAQESGETDSPLLRRDVRLSEFGIEAAGDIGSGSLSVFHSEDGPVLGVPTFLDALPERSKLPPSTSAAPPATGGCFDLRVEQSVDRNALGGRFGTFVGGSSTATVDLDADAERRKVLRLRCSREGGPCGLWLHLFETGNPRARTYLDATELGTFFGRGAR